MTRNSQNWLRDCAIGLSKRVEDRGLSLSVDAAESFLAERHITAAEHLDMSPRAARQFLNDAALNELADRLVADFADEAPGGDLFSLPRTATITVTKLRQTRRRPRRKPSSSTSSTRRSTTPTDRPASTKSPNYSPWLASSSRNPMTPPSMGSPHPQPCSPGSPAFSIPWPH